MPYVMYTAYACIYICTHIVLRGNTRGDPISHLPQPRKPLAGADRGCWKILPELHLRPAQENNASEQKDKIKEAGKHETPALLGKQYTEVTAGFPSNQERQPKRNTLPRRLPSLTRKCAGREGGRDATRVSR